MCLLDRDEGDRCSNEEDDDEAMDRYYYYDGGEGECVGMMGYRCGGNGNRFQSQLDCLEHCDPSSEHGG